MTITIRKLHLAIAVLAVALIAPATALATHIFVDVDDARFYAGPIEWALDNDITTGSPAGSDTFKPDDPVTRGESVTFLDRYDTNITQPALTDLEGDIATNAAGITTNATDIATNTTGIATKANAADVYTQVQVDAALFRRQAFVGSVRSSGAKRGVGSFTTTHPATGRYTISFDFTGAGVPEALGPMTIVVSPGISCHGDSAAHAGWTGAATDADGFLTVQTLEVHTTVAGVQTDCDFSFIATLAGSDELMLP